MSFPGQDRRAWENYSPAYTNQTLPAEDPHYGNVRKVYAAGQLGKRTRSSSNEDFDSRLSQVQVWLKDQATAEDFEKIWRIFLDSKASSATETYGAAGRYYQGNLEDVDPVLDIPAHSSNAADLASASGLSLPTDFSQCQDFLDPQSLIHDYSMNSFTGQPSAFSMVSPSEPNSSTIPSRSRASLHSETRPAVAATRELLRKPLFNSKQDKSRDLVQSTSSYNSMNSDMSMEWSSKHSSTSSFGSQSVQLLRNSSQKPMHMSIKKSHSRSSSTSRASNSIQSSDIPCSYSVSHSCTSTFTRDPDRIRHEDVFHINKVRYTCLLHTCAASCSEHCKDKIHHSQPYKNGRPDKMKEHLEKVHNWSLKVNEIPKAFRHSYDWRQRGWICRACGEFIGDWHENRDTIEGHEMTCGVLQASLKRMSVEEPGVGGARKGGDMEKRWPLPGGQEDQISDWV